MRDEPSVSESEDAPAMPAGIIITSAERDRHAENNMKAAGARTLHGIAVSILLLLLFFQLIFT